MARYWVYIDSKIQGPVDVPALRKIAGFTLLTQVCSEGEQTWRMADEIVEIKSYFLSPPRASTLLAQAANGDIVRDAGPALTVIDPEPAIEAPPMVRPVLDAKGQEPLATAMMGQVPAPTPEPVIVPFPAKESAGPLSLRQVCEKCGYKNPRDVNACMKCGSSLGDVKESGAPGPGTKAAEVPIPVPATKGPDPRPSPSLTPASSAAMGPTPSPMIEIPVTRILIMVVSASVIGVLGFVGFRLAKKHAHPAKVVAAQRTMTPSTPRVAAIGKSYRRSGRTARRVRAGRTATALPGMSHNAAPVRRTEPVAKVSPPADDPSTSAPYRVIEEATPVRHRNPAPVDSPYAVKRRADKKVWQAQEEQAIQQVQHDRIYGGLRTIQRNADILMQILRDREYNTAFESGKRIYLYNDMDWDVSQKDGPVYEVRLTFSGGRESDGLARQPLKFAFDTDLERGSVDPGGDERIRSNTMHAFFDESRIPPEDRRAIAKDTEELVLAAQPDASPLALDTVMRHFIATYTRAALERVAGAYGLSEVLRKLKHEPKIVSDVTPAETPAAKETDPMTGWGLPPSARVSPTSDKTPQPATPPANAPLDKPAVLPKGESLEYQMTSGVGRERLVTVRARSTASAAKLWDMLTGYDQLKQFVPDLLVSEREGQDGGAVIVHAVALTRLYFFVFKVNLHLRVIEHPQQHTLEFERIAGEFEQFRGAVEISSEAAGGPSVISFHATVVPKGVMPSWALRDMAKRLLIPLIEAVRTRAEQL